MSFQDDQGLETGGAREHLEPADRGDGVCARKPLQVADQRRRVAGDVDDPRRARMGEPLHDAVLQPAPRRIDDHDVSLQPGGNIRIQSASDPRIAKALPPDGGVSFCLLGVPPGQAERTLVSTGRSYPCFNVEGACVTCFDFSEVTDYFVYRD